MNQMGQYDQLQEMLKTMWPPEVLPKLHELEELVARDGSSVAAAISSLQKEVLALKESGAALNARVAALEVSRVRLRGGCHEQEEG